jgi:predicted DNA-binding transcriptional regulator YafY
MVKPKPKPAPAKPRQGRRRGGYSQAVRVLKLLDHLRTLRAGQPLADLASRFDVTERQLRRDLDVLEQAGNALDWVDSSTGPRRVKLKVNHQLVRLGIGDRFALLAVRRVFDVLRGTPIHAYIDSVQTRLIDSLPEADRAELEQFGERFVYFPDGGVKDYADKAELLDDLVDGVVNRRRVRFSYATAGGKATTGVLEPWAIALYRQGLYIIGRADVDGRPAKDPAAPIRPVVYAAERFVETEALRGERFEVPGDFKLDDLRQGAFGLWISSDAPSHVVVDFDKQARPFIEARTWHPTQRLSRLPDGGARLEFDVADTTLVLPWVLSWGALARIQAPDALVAKARDVAAALPARYGVE